MCIYIYIYIYIVLLIFSYVCIYVCMYVYIYIYIYIYVLSIFANTLRERGESEIGRTKRAGGKPAGGKGGDLI